MKKNIFLPASLLAGAIIGAGMFSLPYVFAKVGLGIGFIYLVLLTAVTTLIHLLYGDVIIRTAETHNFVGYLRIYLGKTAAALAVFVSVIELPLVLVIYLLLAISFGNLVLGSEWIGNQSVTVVFIFWLLGSLALVWDVKEMARIQFFITLSIVAMVFLLLIYGISEGANLLSLPLSRMEVTDWLLPVGPILFALAGRVAVVEVFRYFAANQSAAVIRRTILLGTILPAIVYGIFILAVLSLTPLPTEDAVTGLLNRLPVLLLKIVGWLGLAALWTSYVAIVFDVQHVLRVDLGVSKAISNLFLFLAPITLYFLIGGTGFFRLVALVGGIFLSLEGLLVVKVWLAASKQNSKKPVLLANIDSAWVSLLILLFVVVLLYEVWNIFSLINLKNL